MSAVVDKIARILTEAYSTSNYVDLMTEVLEGIQIVSLIIPQKEFTSFSSHIENYTHVGTYTSPDKKKIIVRAVELKNRTYVENSRSTQRSYAKKLIENANADGALIAFHTTGETRWRLSFVRLDYDIKIESGRLKTAENLTPARRYSFLVGKDEPCHTAIERFRLFLDNHATNPTLDELEKAFSVEAVTKEFFELYCDKYLQLRDCLEKNENFVSEAKLHNYTSTQFAKKLLGQIVFLYFLQKKGWLGVSAWPKTLSATEYKRAFHARGSRSRELIPAIYVQVDENTYRINTTALNRLSIEEETFLSTCVKGEPWGSGPHNFMRRLFETSEKKGANFFEAYLEPLFYDALNVNRGEQGYDPALHCRIPFLSGGLFEPLDGYEWKHNDFNIPNELFSNRTNENDRLADGILDIFDRYNFTMSEDEPLEREVAIDPEMLGKVFENLLDVNDRKNKGAFYTPREIVHYMCQESLINYLTNMLKVKEMAIRDFVLYSDFMKDEDASVLKRAEKGDSFDLWISEELYLLGDDGAIKVDRIAELDQALQDVRVADPAVGSGAFPLGMLNEIVRARQNITTYMDITQKIKDSKGASREIRYRRVNERSARQLKYDTIRNCIFAVDIEPSAVDIAQLRLWLALVIDDEIDPNAMTALDGHRNPLPLPNLECNILCGNSLIDEFEGIKLINESDLIGTADATMQFNMYQSAFTATLERLITKQEELFKCDNTDKKSMLLQEISDLRDAVIISQLRGTATSEQMERYQETKQMASKPFVLWQLDFAKVFREKGGFDIVIGNPPYLGEKAHKKVFDPINNSTFGKRFHCGRMDLFYYFFHKGMDILRENASLAFITTNYYITATGGIVLRQDFKTRTSMRTIINFNEAKIFESALGQHNMITMLKKGYDELAEAKVKMVNVKGFLGNAGMRDILYNSTDFRCISQRDLYDGDKNYIRLTGASEKTFNQNDALLKGVLQKILHNSTPLGTICDVRQGARTGADKVTDAHLRKYKTITEPKGKGIFVLTNKEIADSPMLRNTKVLKPWFKNSDVNRYYTKQESTLHVIYSNSDVSPVDIKIICDYLDKFMPILKGRNTNLEWFQIDRPREQSIFESEKIVTSQRTLKNSFGYNNTSWYSSADVYYIVNSREGFTLKYILALLNSKLFYCWLFNRGKRKGNLLEMYQEPLSEVPVKLVCDDYQKEIIFNVERIIDAKKDNPKTDTFKAENRIDEILYKAFGLTEDEMEYVNEVYQQFDNYDIVEELD